jgi:hypothetical protein
LALSALYQLEIEACGLFLHLGAILGQSCLEMTEFQCKTMKVSSGTEVKPARNEEDVFAMRYGIYEEQKK